MLSGTFRVRSGNQSTLAFPGLARDLSALCRSLGRDVKLVSIAVIISVEVSGVCVYVYVGKLAEQRQSTSQSLFYICDMSLFPRRFRLGK